MKFLKKNAALIILTSIFFAVLFCTEIMLTATYFPKYSMGFFTIFAISSVQYLSYIKTKKKVEEINQTIKKEMNVIKQNFTRQERINRNLMFAIEEIIDLQRAKTPSEQAAL